MSTTRSRGREQEAARFVAGAMFAVGVAMFSIGALSTVAACAPAPSSGGEGEGGAGEGEGGGSAGEGEGAVGEGEGEGAAGEGEGEGVAAAGFGDISGDCDVLDDELTSTAPSFFANAIDFHDNGYDDADLGLLTPDGQEMVAEGNAGGSSLMSEVFAFEVLARCEGASLLKTETQIVYDGNGTITDILVQIDGMKVGVSVTRAVAFPFDDPYTLAEADHIVRVKLQGIIDSTGHVDAQDRWVKQILSVIAYSPEHAALIRQAWDAVEPELKADTIVVVTASNGDDAFLY